ncbi:MAG: glycosyltransferase family 2 protein [Suipraeoptans sp.]
MNIKLSIIIPIYNAEKYLEECLNSIFPLLNEKIEVLLVDDGSNDGSGAICNEFVSRSKQFRYFRKQNGGPSSARNRGIKEATGCWITFVDADDTIVFTSFEKILLQLNVQTDILYFKCRTSKDKIIIDDKKLEAFAIDNNQIRLGLLSNDLKYFRKLTKSSFNFSSPFGKFYKLEFIRKNDITFPIDLNWGEDVFFNFVALGKFPKCLAMSIEGYIYNVNEDSITNLYKEDKRNITYKLCENMETIIPKTREYKEAFYSFGLKQYMFALKLDCCNRGNLSTYRTRKKQAQLFGARPIISDCVRNADVTSFRMSHACIAFLIKKKQFWIVNFLYKVIYKN